MHSKGININDDYYINIYENIKRHVPVFKSIFDKDQIYPIAFELGNFLKKNIDNDELVKQCAKFINEAIDIDSSITKELIMTEVFQVLYEENENLVKKIEIYLDDEVMNIYKKYLKTWIPLYGRKRKKK